ncbi:MAG: hypothetical protein EXR86_01580 [Gammaproteobacteria bacterium]|nr:hypothetical protein [Gammaproteobacteria bacterium]
MRADQRSLPAADTVNSAFYPTIDNFERALKFSHDESCESKLDKLEALVVGSYRRPLTDVRFIATILSLPCEARYGPSTMTPQRQKDETIRALVDLVDAAARLQPTLMLFEDAHWADPTSLEVLDLLIDRISHLPLLMVLTHRPEFQPRWSHHGHVTALNLSKLTHAQSSALVSRLTYDKALPAELLEQILAKTDGVPLYVEEATKSILESGTLKEVGGRYAYVGSAHTFTIPATLRDSLVARLDRVPEVKEIAQIGAVIGREFSYELIAAVASRATPELDRALDQLTESGLAFRRGAPPHSIYIFKHALVQDAAYDSLLKSRRIFLHTAIARALAEKFPSTKDTEPELLAHHLTAAGLIERAVPMWQKAGSIAFNRLALNEAISHLNNGLGLIRNQQVSTRRDEAELDLRVLLGTAWMAFKGWQAEEVASNLRPALALAKALGRDELLMPIYQGLCMNVLVQGRVVEALDWVKQILALAASTNTPDLLIVGHMQASVVYSWHGEWITARAHGEKVLALYHPDRHGHIVNSIGSDPKTGAGIYAAQWNWMLGYPDQAVTVSDANCTHARALKHPFNLGFALIVGVFVFDYRGEPEALIRRVEEAEQVGRDASMPYLSEVLAQVNRGIATLLAGRTDEGIPQLRRAMEIYQANGGGVWMPYIRAVLAEGHALSGDVEAGLSLIEESLAQIARPGWGERCHLAEVLRLKGWMLSLQNDVAGAEQNYLASLDVARQQQAKSWELRTATSLARLWQDQGKVREAGDLLASLYGWFTEGFDTKDLKQAKALLDSLV